MKNYYLENISDGVIVLRKGQATLQLNKGQKQLISESVIMIFKDQIAKLSKEDNKLKMYPVGANVEPKEVEKDVPAETLVIDEDKEVVAETPAYDKDKEEAAKKLLLEAEKAAKKNAKYIEKKYK